MSPLLDKNDKTEFTHPVAREDGIAASSVASQKPEVPMIMYNVTCLLNDPSRSRFEQESLLTRHWGSKFIDKPVANAAFRASTFEQDRSELTSYVEILEKRSHYCNTPRHSAPVANNDDQAMSFTTDMPTFESKLFNIFADPSFDICKPGTFAHVKQFEQEIPSMIDVTGKTISIMLTSECSQFERVTDRFWGLRRDINAILVTARSALDKERLTKMLQFRLCLLGHTIRYERCRQILHLMNLMSVHRDSLPMIRAGDRSALDLLRQSTCESEHACKVTILAGFRNRLDQIAGEFEELALGDLSTVIDQCLHAGQISEELVSSLNAISAIAEEKKTDLVTDCLIRAAEATWRQERDSSKSTIVDPCTAVSVYCAKVESSWGSIRLVLDFVSKRLVSERLQDDLCLNTHRVCQEILQSGTARFLSANLDGKGESISLTALKTIAERLCNLSNRLSGNKNGVIHAWLQGNLATFVGRFDEVKRNLLARQLEEDKWISSGDLETGECLLFDDPASAHAKIRMPRQAYVVARSVNLLVEITKQYLRAGGDYEAVMKDKHEGQLSADSGGQCPFVLRLIELVKFFNSRTCQLIIGAGAVETAKLRTITIRHISLAVRSIQFVRKVLVEEVISSKILQASRSNVYLSKQVQRLSIDLGNHEMELLSKICSLAEMNFEISLINYEAKPPTPSKPITDICRKMQAINDQCRGVLSEQDRLELMERVDQTFKKMFASKVIGNLGIIDDAGPEYALVNTDLSYYDEFVVGIPGCVHLKLSPIWGQ